ncbi:MAG: multicopper oxidase domain-containing protein, partial [Gemmatimonadales bacterium]|nr:multicopper oxidase domain-containing protein [Gemmatimonadales bacterium]
AGSLCTVVLLLGGRLSGPPTAAIIANDNRHAAGTLRNGVLSVALEARTGVWEPDGKGATRITTAAFAEVGRPLQNPGPLLRVRTGTEVRATFRNSLAVPLWIYGMGSARGYTSDSFDIAPGATREVRFRAGAPGTYYYSGRTAPGPVFARLSDDSQLNGVIVIDPAGIVAPDRIFVISSWFTVDTTTVSGLGPHATLAFNGLSWPHSEPLTATQGDTLRYRFVNVTPLEHPLHLHGFYFRVDSRGDGRADTAYAPGNARMGVTELLLQGETMGMSWSPVRSGNWILHCHFASHITSSKVLEYDRRMPATVVHGGHAVTPSAGTRGNPMQHNMAGLVLGIRVAPKVKAVASTAAARPIRLIVRSRADVYDAKYVGYSYVLGGSTAESDTTAMPIPGPTLRLVRGERVAVTIVNQTHENAAVHWHGIELESFPDGVAGWSGDGKTTLPMIAPDDSLTVRFTPPRAGTFMYHSHSNEFQQIGSGLYGALVVTEPVTAGPPQPEQVLLFSDNGPTLNFFRPPPAVLLNGRPLADTISLAAGVAQRLRLINILTDRILEVSLLQGPDVGTWRVVAKDGFDLPPARMHAGAASVRLAAGEIVDVEVTPGPGPLSLRVATLGSPPSEPAPVVPVALK